MPIFIFFYKFILILNINVLQGQPRLHRPTSSNHLHPHPPYIPGRSLLGGSLPNVNTMAVNPQLDHMVCY